MDNGTGEGMGVGRTRVLAVGVVCGVPCGAQGAVQSTATPRPMFLRASAHKRCAARCRWMPDEEAAYTHQSLAG